jgi:hypothetical protein
MSHDTKCYDLAEYFVASHVECRKETVNELAELIQETIEDFLTESESDDPDPDRLLEDRRERDRDEWKHEAAEQQRLK